MAKIDILIEDRKKRKESQGLVKTKKKFLVVKTLLSFLLKSSFFSSIVKKDISSLQLKKYEYISEKTYGDVRILFLSDFHLDVVNNFSEIKKITKNCKYDFIVLGGDYLDTEKSFENSKGCFIELMRYLKTLSDNVISILGNHDSGSIIKILDSETNLLISESIHFKGVSFYGIEDFVTFKDTKDCFKLSENNFNILLSHTPDFELELKNRYDLMLSGHTHGGQISFFGFRPINNCKNKIFIYGQWETERIKGITTSGVGCSGLPARLNVRPEIVEITIKNSL